MTHRLNPKTYFDVAVLSLKRTVGFASSSGVRSSFGSGRSVGPAQDQPPQKPSWSTDKDINRDAIRAFDLLIDMSASDRAAWLAEKASIEPVLAIQVARLLQADRRAARAISDSPRPANDVIKVEPIRVGVYRMLQRLGRAQDNLFVAERDDGLFQHTVAIKIFQRTDVSDQALDRFQEERRILARLQHPHIGLLFDGGKTEWGAFYLVMEYVPGDAITKHFQNARPPINQALKTFISVCNAVQFSHQNLIVHADIAPENIVISLSGVPKIVNFNIARFLEPIVGVAEVEAAAPYCSNLAPERVRGGPATVSGDIYSLGLILRQLVTGRASDEAPHLEVKRSVKTPASSFGGLLGAASDLVQRRSRRETGLDAIVIKTLKIAPGARYATVAELAEDVGRYLNRKPVKALPWTWSYVSGLFIRRHRLSLGFLSAAAILTAIAAVVSSLLFLQSEQERRFAEARFNQTRAMANFVIENADPLLSRLPGNLEVRKRLVEQSRRYLTNLADDQRASNDLKIEIARGYLRLARIYGFDTIGGLGNFAEAKASLNRAQQIVDEVSQREPGRTDLLLARAEVDAVEVNRDFLAPDQASMHEEPKLIAALERDFQIYLKEEPADIDAFLEKWRAEGVYGLILSSQGKFQQSKSVLIPLLRFRDFSVKTAAQLQQKNINMNGTYRALEEVYSNLHDYKSEDAIFNTLIGNIRSIRARGGDDVGLDNIEGTANLIHGRALYNRGDVSGAKINFKKAIRDKLKTLSVGANNQVETQLAEVEANLAVAERASGEVKKAYGDFANAFAIALRHFQHSPQNLTAQKFLQHYTMMYVNGARSPALRSNCRLEDAALRQLAAIKSLPNDFTLPQLMSKLQTNDQLCPVRS